MKQKKLNKKLSLNKNTIAHLNNTNMAGIKGGETEACTANCPTMTCQTKALGCCDTTTIDYTLPGGTGLDCYSFGDNCGHSAETCN